MLSEDELRTRIALRYLFESSQGTAILTLHILRNWDRDKIRAFALSLLGDDWQVLDAKLFEAQGVIRQLRADIVALRDRLPEALRRYITDLETRCDPAGDVQTMASLLEQRDALLARVKELENPVK